MLITKEDVVKRYLDGDSTNNISTIAGVSTRYIRMVLSAANVKVRNAKRPPKYNINTDFFKNWSNEMAYVLGFILTDGCVSKNTVTFAQKDKEILERINTVMNSNYPISERQNGKNTLFLLNISRKEIFEDLAKLGITEKKSLTVEFPEVPTHYLGHFVRGVIDGDGWVHGKGYVMNVTSGSFLFAYHLHELFNRCGFNGRLVKQNGVYRIWVSGKNDIVRLGRWLYRDCGVLFLERKRERFEVNDI